MKTENILIVDFLAFIHSIGKARLSQGLVKCSTNCRECGRISLLLHCFTEKKPVYVFKNGPLHHSLDSAMHLY